MSAEPSVPSVLALAMLIVASSVSVRLYAPMLKPGSPASRIAPAVVTDALAEICHAVGVTLGDPLSWVAAFAMMLAAVSRTVSVLPLSIVAPSERSSPNTASVTVAVALTTMLLIEARCALRVA